MDSEQTDEALEDELGIQLEEAMKECTRELGLIPKMLEWQPWDVPADYKVTLPAQPACLPFVHCALPHMALPRDLQKARTAVRARAVRCRHGLSQQGVGCVCAQQLVGCERLHTGAASSPVARRLTLSWTRRRQQRSRRERCGAVPFRLPPVHLVQGI